MRCMGLTNERRRCISDSIQSTRYCSEHLPSAPAGNGARGEGAKDTLAQSRTRLGQLLSRLGPPSRGQVRDDARYEIPGWLKKSSTPQVIEQLLNGPNVRVRWLAAFTLRKRRDPIAIEPLWQVLEREPSSFVRQQAAVALGKIGTLAVQAPLVESLWHDPDAAVRQACAIALGNLGYVDASGELATILEREQATFVRWDCVVALGQVGERNIEPILHQLASEDRAEVVRNACQDALADIRKRGNARF